MTTPNDHAPGSRSIELEVEVPGTPEQVWEAIATGPGIAAWFVPAEAAEGERTTTTAPGAPALAGTVEQVTASRHARVLLLRIDEPAPGSALVAAFTYGGATYASLHAYLFGDRAPAVAAQQEPAWRAWMAERFPSATTKTAAGSER